MSQLRVDGRTQQNRYVARLVADNMTASDMDSEANMV